MLVATAVEESRLETLRAYERTVASAAQRDWERTKRRIFEELGHAGLPTAPAMPSTPDTSYFGGARDLSALDRSGLGTSLLGASLTSSLLPVRPPPRPAPAVAAVGAAVLVQPR